MKPARIVSFVLLGLVAWAAAGVGCRQISPKALAERRFYESREITPDRRTAISLCRKALENMGFVHEAGSPAGGQIEMVSRVLPGQTSQLLRQRRVYLKTDVGTGGGALVTVGFWEVTEDGSSEQQVNASGRLIRGGSLYEAFWARLVDVINEADGTTDAEVRLPPPKI